MPIQDPAFLAASPEDQHAYLVDTDPDYKSASPADQKAYLQSLRPSKSAFSRYVAEPLTGAATRAISAPGSALADLIGMARGDMPAAAAAGERAGVAAARPIAEMAVPQTAGEAGAMLAMGPAGKAANVAFKGGKMLSRGARVGTRVLGGAAGGAAGGALEGEGASGAQDAALGVLLGEGLGAAGGFMARRMPWRDVYKNQEFRAQVGAAIRRIVPEAGHIKSADDFVRFAAEAKSIPGSGKATLGKILDDADEQINKKLGGQRLTLPTNAAFPVSYTYDQAQARLQSLHRRAYTADAARDSDAALRLRDEARQLRQDIVGELEKVDPKLASLYDVSRQKFDKGLELVRTVRAAIKPGAEGAVLDEMALQRQILTRLDKAQMNFKRSLGELDAFHQAVTRGAPVGAQSKIHKSSVSSDIKSSPMTLGLGPKVGRGMRPSRYAGEFEQSGPGRVISDYLGLEAVQEKKKRD